MHFNNFNNNSDATAEAVSEGGDDDDVLVTDAPYDKMSYVKVSGGVGAFLVIELRTIIFRCRFPIHCNGPFSNLVPFNV